MTQSLTEFQNLVLITKQFETLQKYLPQVLCTLVSRALRWFPVLDLHISSI